MVTGAKFSIVRVNLATGKTHEVGVGRIVNDRPVCCPRCGDPFAKLVYAWDYETDDILKEGYCPLCRDWWSIDIRHADQVSLEQWFCLLVACGLSDTESVDVTP